MYTYAIRLDKNNGIPDDIPGYMAANMLTADDIDDALRIIDDAFDSYSNIDHIKRAVTKAIADKTCFGMYHYGKLIGIAAYDFLFKGHLFAATERSWLRNGCAATTCRTAMDDMYAKGYRYALAIVEDNVGIKFVESLGDTKYIGSHMSLLSEFTWTEDNES